jgi:hypothetical protein
MKEAKEIYKLIEQSELSKEDQDRLYDWYSNAHTKVTEKSLAKLERIKRWRERRISRIQNKVLRRLK